MTPSMLQLGWDYESAGRMLVTEALFTAKVSTRMCAQLLLQASALLSVRACMQQPHQPATSWCPSYAATHDSHMQGPRGKLKSVQADREQLTQLLFESFQVEGLFLAEQPVLALYSLGRLAGCVVDVGHDKTGHYLVTAVSACLACLSLLMLLALTTAAEMLALPVSAQQPRLAACLAYQAGRV